MFTSLRPLWFGQSCGIPLFKRFAYWRQMFCFNNGTMAIVMFPCWICSRDCMWARCEPLVALFATQAWEQTASACMTSSRFHQKYRNANLSLRTNHCICLLANTVAFKWTKRPYFWSHSIIVILYPQLKNIIGKRKEKVPMEGDDVSMFYCMYFFILSLLVHLKDELLVFPRFLSRG